MFRDCESLCGPDVLTEQMLEETRQKHLVDNGAASFRRTDLQLPSLEHMETVYFILHLRTINTNSITKHYTNFAAQQNIF